MAAVNSKDMHGWLRILRVRSVDIQKAATNAARVVAFLVTLCCPLLPAAQDYPARRINMIVAALPGGVPDTLARGMAPEFATILGQPVTIENIGGAGGMVGVRALLSAPPDGYTILFTDNAKWAIAPALQSNLYDPVKELAPIGRAVSIVQALFIGGDFPAKNLQEFIAAVKAKPGFYQYGSSGNGSFHHLAMESLKAAYGLDIVHIPYKGSPQTSVALLGGEVQVAVLGPGTVQPQLQSGRLKLIAVFSKQRSKYYPDVPSVSEVGASDLDLSVDIAYVARAGTPKAAIDKLGATLAKVVQQPAILARIEKIGAEPSLTTPEELGRIIREDQVRYKLAVKLSGMKVD